jgi:hypothetical protein
MKPKTTKTAILAELRTSLNDDVDYAKRRKASLSNEGVRVGAALLAAVINKAETLLPGAVYHSEYVNGNSHRLNASVNTTVASLKSAEVEAFLSWLEDNVAPALSSSDYASEYNASRSFEYRHENLSMELCFSLPVDGDACSRVKTGVKLVEQATYELRCA